MSPSRSRTVAWASAAGRGSSGMFRGYSRRRSITDGDENLAKSLRNDPACPNKWARRSVRLIPPAGAGRRRTSLPRFENSRSVGPRLFVGLGAVVEAVGLQGGVVGFGVLLRRVRLRPEGVL